MPDPRAILVAECIAIATALKRSDAILVTALESIAKNSCCAACQEASLVATKALVEAHEVMARVLPYNKDPGKAG